MQNTLQACVFATYTRGLPLGIILRHPGGFSEVFYIAVLEFFSLLCRLF